jgi:osmotically-inducible protein OsmY
MVEMIFGSGSPMWTAMPAMGLPYQPMGFGTLPINTPGFSSPSIAGGIGAGSAGAQGLSAQGALSSGIYGYGGSVTPNGQSNLAGPGLAVAYPFASNSLAAQIADATGVVTASSMLAAVAMRRGQPQGPTSDAEVEEFIYDALDLLPGAADVEIRCESGRVTITGSVQHKRTKRDVGEIAWAIPGLQDVQNNVSITSRRRARTAGRETETPASVSARKQG